MTPSPSLNHTPVILPMRLQPPLHVNTQLRGPRCELLPPVRHRNLRRGAARRRLWRWFWIMVAACAAAAVAVSRL
jgi:hypothetical protein